MEPDLSIFTFYGDASLQKNIFDRSGYLVTIFINHLNGMEEIVFVQ